MSTYRVRYQTIEVGRLDIHVRTLRDKQQCDEDDEWSRDLGISSAQWPVFGVLWESGRVLAELMVDHEIEGLRILEVGCGIGLASLVLNRRDADITATDHHPRAESFLLHNSALNGGTAIPFVRTGWENLEDSGMGRFDLIIGSDLLYERLHVALLSAFIERHARARCEVLLVDPGRRHGGLFSRAMEELGYASSRTLRDVPGDDAASPDHVLRFLRPPSRAA